MLEPACVSSPPLRQFSSTRQMLIVRTLQLSFFSMTVVPRYNDACRLSHLQLCRTAVTGVGPCRYRCDPTHSRPYCLQHTRRDWRVRRSPHPRHLRVVTRLPTQATVVQAVTTGRTGVTAVDPRRGRPPKRRWKRYLTEPLSRKTPRTSRR